MDGEEPGSSILFEDPTFYDFTLCLIIDINCKNRNETIKRGKGKRKRNTQTNHDEEDVEIMKVSKAVLAMKCKYFHTMFKSGMKEQQDSEARMVFESELERDTFKQFIRFIYTKEIANDTDLNIFMKLADRFNHYGAIASVTKKMPTNLTIKQCCEWLDMLILYKDKQETQDAIKKIERSLVTLFHKFEMEKENKAFQQLPQVTSKNAIILLLGSDLLTPYSEDVVFRAAYEWYCEHEDKVKGLVELESVFRWKHMSADFLSCINLLPEIDVTLFHGIVSGLHCRASKTVPTPPNTRRVTGRTGTLVTFSKDKKMRGTARYGGYKYAIDVNVKDHQITSVIINKLWPPKGSCTFPLNKVLVTENGKTTEYPLKDVVLEDQVKVSLNVVHKLDGKDDPQSNLKLRINAL